MSDLLQENRTVIFSECLFLPYLKTESKEFDPELKRPNAFSNKVKNDLLELMEEIFLGTFKNEDAHQQTLLACTTAESVSEFGLFAELSNIAEKYDAKVKVLEQMETFEKTLLVAKSFIDANSENQIIIVLPQPQHERCFKTAKLIFNDSAYMPVLAAIPFDYKLYPIVPITDEEIAGDVRNVLSQLASSDGLDITTLKSPMISETLFYHGYTTRTGGVSTFPTMKSLALAFSPRKKDTRIFVEENRRRLSEVAGFDHKQFYIAKAVHGTDVWIFGDEPPSSYDAIVTDKPGVTIAAPGADCQTLLFCDSVKKVVAACHSGWKGTIDRIQQNVVRVMKEKYGCEAEDICVSIGPSIGSCCYNVLKDRADEFIKGVSEETVIYKEGVAFLDCWKATVILLLQVGIKKENIDDGTRFTEMDLKGKQKVTQCTQCNPEKFFSFRRDGAIFGNQIGFIGIKKNP